MRNLTEQNNTIWRSVIVSSLLHLVLIALIVWGSFHQHLNTGGGSGGQVIDAIMVDPNAVAQQYHRRQQQQIDAKRAAELLKSREQQKADELKARQMQEQQRLKELAKERIKAQEEANQLAQQKKQAEELLRKAQQTQRQAEEKAQAALLAKKKIEEKVKKEAAERAAKEQEQAAEKAKQVALDKVKQQAAEKAKQVALDKAKQQAAEKAKQVALDKAKQQAEAAKKQAQEVDSLLGGLASVQNRPSAAGADGGGDKAGLSGPKGSHYGSLIGAAITNKLFNCPIYLGKECDLKIHLSPTGKILDAKAQSGDQEFCQEAVSAAKQARVPVPTPSEYKLFKEASVALKLESCIQQN